MDFMTAVSCSQLTNELELFQFDMSLEFIGSSKPVEISFGDFCQSILTEEVNKHINTYLITKRIA